MIPPDTAIKSVLEALARNDYPEEDAGVKTAYAFSKPHDCERLLAGQVLHLAEDLLNRTGLALEHLLSCRGKYGR